MSRTHPVPHALRYGMRAKRKFPMSTVIVIGAGVAGLAAAKRLKETGHTAVVLEATARAGGRVFTDVDGLDLGAQWIHGNHPDFEAYCASLGLATVNTDFTKMNLDGQPLSAADFNDLTTKIAQAVAWDMTWRPNVALYYTLTQAYAQGHFSPHSESRVRLMGVAGVDVEWANDAHNIPARAAFDVAPWFWDSEAWSSQASDNTAFVDGFGQVVDALAADLAIHYGEPVTGIAWTSTGVSVTTPQSTYVADWCICTVPLGVLKANAISFSPALPTAKTGAIRRMGVGLLNKVILEFPEGTQLPAADVLGSNAGSGPRGACSIWVNVSNVREGRPTLVGWLTGPDAVTREMWTDAAIVAEALTRFPSLPQPVYARVTRWGQEPYARGAYSSFCMSSQLGDRARLREPTGRLLWAGEHTVDTGFAQVSGAWESGIREANRIIG